MAISVLELRGVRVAQLIMWNTPLKYTIERYVGYVMKGDKRGVFSKTLTMKLLELT